MRTCSRSTSASVVMPESSRTTNVPSITTYGAVKATSAARAGSMARKQMSASPRSIAARLCRAAAWHTRSTASPSRAPSSRAVSTATPAGAAGVPCVRTGLPRLIAARRTPPGARSLTTPSRTSPTRVHHTNRPRSPSAERARLLGGRAQGGRSGAWRPCARKVRSLPGNWFRGMTPEGDELIKIDASVAHSARVYDYLLGGKDNFAADREAGDQMIAALPNVVSGSRMNRAFLARAVRYLVADCGIRQFLDIGTGIPSAGNTHEVAQAIAPAARVVYVDNDPIVLAHARALLTGTPEGLVAYLHADLRDLDKILADAAGTLDFTQPVALMMLMVLHMIPDADDPHDIVARLLHALPPGSYLTLSHPPSDILPEDVAKVQ